MGSDDFGGGLWILVAIDSAIFILFAASFFHPRTGRDWKVLGTYSAFIVALFRRSPRPSRRLFRSFRRG